MQNTNQQSSEKASKASGGTNGKWSQSQKQMEEGVHSMSESARKIYDQAVETGSDLFNQANKRATEVVREYPVYATLGGLCIGFLLGASLLGRRAHKEG